MKALKIIATVILSIVLILYLVSFYLPTITRVERSINVGVNDTIAYNYIKDFSKFDEWNPWNDIDSTSRTYLDGEMGEVGSLYGWKGKEVGEGNMKIVYLKSYSMIHQKLSFVEPFASIADNDFTVESIGDSTKVTWIYYGYNKGIIEKWMGLTMDSFIGKDYEKGLAKLKAKLEQ
jgi:hypothetical protein